MENVGATHNFVILVIVDYANLKNPNNYGNNR